MLQRVQTIFLFLAAVCSGLLFLFPFATSETVQSSQILNDGVYDFNDNIAIPILFGAAIVLSIGSLISFKNRKNQTLLARIALIANVIGLVLIFALIMTSGVMEEVEVNDQVGGYLPLGSILMLILAMRFIKKDDDLVSSMDRLR